MEQVFAEIGYNFQQVGGECPEGWIVMSGPRPDDESAHFYTAQADGTWWITAETLSGIATQVENAWRDSEMPRAQQNVTALEYGAEDIQGTAEQWKKYWLSLCKWTAENPDFPDSGKRPAAPNA